MSFLDFIGVKKTLEGATERLRSIKAEQEQIRAELRAIDNSLLSRSELRAGVMAWVDSHGAAFSAAASTALSGILSQPAASLLVPRGPLNRSLVELMSGGRASARGMAEEMRRDPEAAAAPTHQFLCAVFNDEIKAYLAGLVDSLQYEEGLPTEQRAAARQKLSRRLDELNSEESDLRAQAADAGVKL